MNDHSLIIPDLTQEQQDVFVKHECPCHGHLFENCDLDI